MGRTRTVAVNRVVAAYGEYGTVARVAAALGVSLDVVRGALRVAGFTSLPRGGLPVVRDPVLRAPASSPRVTVAVSRAQLLVAQTDAARAAVRRGDQAGADRALGAITADLRLIACAPSDVER